MPGAAPVLPPGWVLDHAGIGHVHAYRADGILRVSSFTAQMHDPQLPDDQDYVLGFEAVRPRVYSASPCARLEGDDLADLCSRVDATWPPLAEPPPPTPGMTVFYQRATYAVATVVKSRIATHPAYRGQEVYRLVLVPFAGTANQHAVRSVALEIPAAAWPRSAYGFFLILDPVLDRTP